MRLESALLTSKEGMDTNGKALAVVGDNISNSNTIGYRAARAEFADLVAVGQGDRLAETVDGVGEGSSLARVRTIHDTGIIEPTGRALDAGISGGGFFMVGDPANPSYTRNGTFRIDDQGRLVSESGLPVLGTPGTGAELGELNITDVDLGGAETSAVEVFGNLNANSTPTEPVKDPATYKEISAAASYTSTQSVYDALGQRHDVLIAFYRGETGDGGNTWVAQAYMDGGDIAGKTEGVPVQIGADVTLKFDGTGAIPEASQAAAAFTAAPVYSNGAAAGNFQINIGSMSQYAGTSLVSNITQDGIGAGNISTYQFDTNGKFYAVLDNGERSLIGTVKLATFRNVDGLQRSGSGLFEATTAAGTRAVGDPGVGVYGSLEGATLERSTVDTAKEFVDLTLFQRAYQANTQVFSTTGQMLRDTIQLIR